MSAPMPAEAVKYLTKAVALKPNDLLSVKNLGVAFFNSGRLNDALNTFLSAERIAPTDTQVLTNISLSYRQLGKIKEANLYQQKAAN